MNSQERRKKLRTYIADLDDARVLALLTMMEEEVLYETKSVLTEKDKNEIRRRVANNKTVKSKTYTLHQSKQMIRRKAS
jgi:hypothetical protein